jgi:hypothetical protein
MKTKTALRSNDLGKFEFSCTRGSEVTGFHSRGLSFIRAL